MKPVGILPEPIVNCLVARLAVHRIADRPPVAVVFGQFHLVRLVDIGRAVPSPLRHRTQRQGRIVTPVQRLHTGDVGRKGNLPFPTVSGEWTSTARTYGL